MSDDRRPPSSPPGSTRAPSMGSGVLSGPIDLDGTSRRAPAFPSLTATKGMMITHEPTGTTGTVAGCTETTVRVKDTRGRVHTFARAAGAFSADGRRVALVPPVGMARQKPAPAGAAAPRTPSGSIAAGPAPARVAVPSRLWVEGVHDAELVEKVWGDDLRAEGVVVERLDGADDLADHVRTFDPTPQRRLGVLLDHLVDGSKEQRLAVGIRHPHVLVRGHPFVDIWQAIKPTTVGIAAWPQIPMGTPWKQGVCNVLEWQGSTGEVWRRLLGSVRTYRDLEPSLLAAVEELIDFVAPPPTHD